MIHRWDVSASPEGTLIARRRDRPIELVVEPALRDAMPVLLVRAIGWGRRRIRVPTWLSERRPIALGGARSAPS